MTKERKTFEFTPAELEGMMVALNECTGLNLPIKRPITEARKKIAGYMRDFLKERQHVIETNALRNDDGTFMTKDGENGLEYVFGDEGKLDDDMTALFANRYSVEIEQSSPDKTVYIEMKGKSTEKVRLEDYIEQATSIPVKIGEFLNEYFIS